MSRERWLGIAVVFTLIWSMRAAAVDVDSLESLNQEEFELFTADMGAALSYKAIAPAEPLGIIGFDIGIEATLTELNSAEAFNKATGEEVSRIVVPKIHLHKGLPFDIDIGASLTKWGELQLLGAELKYAFMEGGVALPAVAIRGSYSQVSGVTDLDLSTVGVELTLSKGFLMLTPYGGVGRVWVSATPSEAITEAVALSESKQGLNRLFVGVNLNLALLNIAAEVDQTGDARSMNAKLGLRF
ncbi:hypothetical protein D5085_15195 [Ectothiorhodospiraceae bacterium BW-2]|nr:hypothetical protein D5085_15195 [Ectothiorhodospiraceae bacterium BW-2]